MYATRYGRKRPQSSVWIASRSCSRATLSGQISHTHSASMPRDRVRLIARRISVWELSCEELAGCMVEQTGYCSMAQLLVDPGEACRCLLEIAELVGIRRNRGREPGLQEVARLLRLALAMEAADRAEIDDERARATELGGERVVLPQRVVALGMREHRHLAGHPQLEQDVDHVRWCARRTDLDQECGSVLV